MCNWRNSFVVITLIMKQILIIIFSSIILFSGCREKISDSFDEFPAKLTINSILTEGFPVKLHVSLSGKISENELHTVNNAVVYLYINRQYHETLKGIGNGLYVSESNVTAGNNYRCEVIAPDYEQLYCEQEIPLKPQITHISYMKNAGKNEEGEIYSSVSFTFNNTLNSIEYYEAKLQMKRFDDFQYVQIQSIDDPVLLSEGLPVTVFSNKMINDKTYTMNLNFRKRDNVNVFVELRKISCDYYMYMRQLCLYETGRYPDFMSGMPAALPVYSNINNGYGIFAGYSCSYSDTLFIN